MKHYLLSESQWITAKRLSLALATTVLLSHSAQASTSTWAGATDAAWVLSNNWSPVGAPATTGTASFAGSSTQTAGLDGTPTQVNTILVSNTGATLIEGNTAASTLVIGGAANSGIDISSGAGTFSIGSPGAAVANDVVTVDIGNSQTWNNGSGSLLTISNGLSIGTPTGSFTLTLNGLGSGGTTFNGAVTDGSGVLSLTINTLYGGPTTLAGANGYSGTTTITTGTLVTSGSNSTAGATTLNGGTLQIDTTSNDGGLASGTLTLSGGTIQSLVTNPTVSNVVTLSGGGGTVSGAKSLTLGGTLSLGGTGATLTSSITGGNTLTLSGTNLNLEATPGTTGTLTLTGTGNTTISSAITDASGAINATGANLTITNTGTTTLSGTNAFGGSTTAGTLTINAGLINTIGPNVGTVVLSGTNSSSKGNTTLNSGILQLDNASDGGLAGGTLSLNAGTIQNTSGSPITVTNPVLLTNNPNGSPTVAAPIFSGPGSITFTGGMSPTVHTDWFNDIASTGTLVISGVGYSTTGFNNILLGTGNTTISGPLTGASGTFSVANTGTTTLSSTSNTYAGGLTLENGSGNVVLSGTLPSQGLSEGGAPGTYGAGTFTYSNSAVQAFSSVTFNSGMATFNNTGTGTLTLGAVTNGGGPGYGYLGTVDFEATGTGTITTSGSGFLAATEYFGSGTNLAYAVGNGASANITGYTSGTALPSPLTGGSTSTNYTIASGGTVAQTGTFSASTLQVTNAVSSGVTLTGSLLNPLVIQNGLMDSGGSGATLTLSGGTINLQGNVYVVTNANNITINDTINNSTSNGAAGLIFSSTNGGSLTLAGINNYSNVTTINSGTLSLTGSINGGGFQVDGTGILAQGATGAWLAPISSGASFSQDSSATTTLGGVNSFVSGATVSNGTLSLTGVLSGQGNYQNGAVLNGTTLTIGATSGQGGTGSFVESSTGVITGNLNVTQNTYFGTTTLAGSNNFGGGLAITTGTVVALGNNAGALGAGAILVGSAGVLDLQGSASVNYGRNVTGSNSNAQFVSDASSPGSAGNTYTFGTLSGVGTTTLDFEGGNNVSSGTAGIAFAGLVETASQNPTFNIVNPVNGGVTVLTLGAISATNNNAFTISLTGNGQLTLNGASNNGSGALTVNMAGANTLNINNSTALGTGVGIVDTTGTNTINSNSVSGSVTLGANVDLLSLTGNGGVATNGNTLTLAETSISNIKFYGGAITGAGGLTMNGAGQTLYLTGASIYTGTTTITNGTIDLGNNSSANTATGSLGNGVLAMGGVGTLNYTTTIGAGTGGFTQTFSGLTVNAGGTAINVAAGDIINLGGITRNAGGIVNLNTNTNTGTFTTTTPNNATGILGTGITIGSGSSLNYAANNGSGVIVPYTYTAGQVATAGSLANMTSATTNYSYTSGSTATVTGPVTGNTLQVTNGITVALGANSLTLNGLMDSAGSPMAITGNPGSLGLVAGTSNELVIAQNGQGINISAVISDNGSTSGLTYGSPGSGNNGTLTLSGIDTYLGATTVGSGTLSLTGQLGSGNYAGALANYGNFVYAGTTGQTLSGALSGTGTLTQSGTGTLTLAGTSGYAGLISASGGALNLTGTLTLNGNQAASPNGISINSANFNESSTGVIAGTGTLSLFGTGNTTLAGANTYTGPTFLQYTGTLTLSGSLTGSNFSTNSGFTLNETSTGFIAGAGTTVSIGSADTVNFAGANTYTGATSIGGGSVLNVTGSLGNTAVSIGTGTLTLGGAGAISQNVVSLTNSGAVLTETAANGLSGTAALTFAGGGAANLSFANNYTGATTLTNSGTLTLSAAGAISGGTIFYNGSTVLTENNANDIGGTAGLTLTGGTLTFSQNNNYTGLTTVSSSTLSLASGTLGSSGVGSNITTLGTGIVTENTAASIGGTGAILTQDSSGTMTLASTSGNTYGGGTVINSGLVIFSNVGAMPGAGTVTLNTGATLQVEVGGTGFFSSATSGNGSLGSILNNPASSATVGGAALEAGSTLDIDTTNATGSTFTYAGNITNFAGNAFNTRSVNLTKTGTGTLVLSGPFSNYTGTMTVSAGTLQLGSQLAMQDALVVDNVATSGLTFSTGTTPADQFTIGALAGTGSITLADTAANPVTLTVGNYAGTGTFTGNLAGAGGITKIGTGTEFLTGALTYTGTTTVTNGTLNIGNGTGTGSYSGGGSLVMGNGGILTLSDTTGGSAATFTGGTTFNTGLATINATSANDTIALNGITRNAGGMVNFNTLGTGTMTTTTGNTNGILGTWASVNTGGSLAYAVANGGSSNITAYGSATPDAGNLASLANPATNYKSGSNDTLTGSQTGNTLQTTAGLTIALGTNDLALNGLLSSGGSLTITSTASSPTTGLEAGSSNELVITNNTNAITISGVIIDNGSHSGLTYGGPSAGTLTLSGVNTYTGVTTVDSGTLSLGAQLNSTSTATVSGTIDGGVTVNGAATFNEIPTNFALSGGGNAVIYATGSIIGTGTFTQNGTGTSTLLGVNTYSGGTVINQGVVDFGGPVSIGTGAVTVNNGGTLAFQVGNAYGGLGIPALGNFASANIASVLGAGTLNPGATVEFDATYSPVANFVYSGNITNTGVGVNKIGLSPVTLGGTNTYTGATTVTAGELGLTGSLSGSSINLSGNANLIESSTGSISGNGVSLTISDSAAGFATSVLAGTNTYTGPTIVNGGAANAGGILDLTGSMTGSDIFVYGTNVNQPGIFSESSTGVIAGTGVTYTQNIGSNVIFEASTLNGLNTYTGATTITGGVLSVNTLANGGSASGIGASSSSPYNLVLNGGTLQYTGSGGSTNRSFYLEASSTLDASGSGAINFTNTASPAGGSSTLLTLTGTNTGANTLAASLANSTSLTKTEVGTWVLTGQNTFSGEVTINGGVLNLGGGLGGGAGVINSGTPNNLLLGGGALVLTTTGTNTQTFLYTTVIAGSSGVANTVATDTINLGSISRQAANGSELNFVTTGTITTTTTNINGILGTWASSGTGASMGYATETPTSVSGLNSIGAYGAGTVLTTSGVNSATTNYIQALAGTTNVTGAVTGNTLQLTGAGTLANGGNNITLNGLMNSGTGAMTLSGAGNIVIGSGAGSGDELVVISNGQNTTISSAITGPTGALTYGGVGTGTLTLTGANTYGGATTIGGGTLDIGGAGTLSTANYGPGIYSGAITISTDGTLLYTSSASQTFSGVLSGAGALNVNTTGTLTLFTQNQANSLTGPVTLTAGTLALEANAGNGPTGLGGALSPIGTLTLAGGDLDIVSQGMAINRNVIVTGNATITPDQIVAGASDNAGYSFGSLTIGADTLTVADSAGVPAGNAQQTTTFTTVNLTGNATLSVGARTVVTTASTTLNGNTLTISGAGFYAQEVGEGFTPSAGNLEFGPAYSAAYAGSFQNLSTANLYSGWTGIFGTTTTTGNGQPNSGGNVTFNMSSALGDGSFTNVLALNNGGELLDLTQIAGNTIDLGVNRQVLLGTSGGYIGLNGNGGDTLVIDGQISGSGSLGIINSATGGQEIILAGNNINTGGVTWAGGNTTTTLAIASNNALGTGTLTVDGGWAAGDLEGYAPNTAYTLANGIILKTTMTVTGTDNLTFTGNARSNAGADLLLATPSTVTTTFAGGIDTSANVASFQITGTGNMLVNSVISDLGDVNGGSLVLAPTGTVTFSGANTFLGSTGVGQSNNTTANTTLVLQNNSAAGANYSQFVTVYKDNNVPGGNSVVLQKGISVNQQFGIQGTGTSTQQSGVGSGTLDSATGSNTLNGLISLQSNSTIRSEAGSTLTLTGLTGTDVNLVNHAVSLNGFALDLDGPGAINITGNINGTGSVALQKTGTGTTTLSGVDSYSGQTQIFGGTLSVGNVANLNTSSIIWMDFSLSALFTPSDTLAYTGLSGTYIKGITIGSTGEVDVTQAGQTLTLSGTNLVMTMTNNGQAIVFGGAGNVTATSSILDSGGGADGGITMAGTGTLTLEGTANAYAGPTTVNAGTLDIGGGTAHGLIAASNVDSNVSNLVMGGGTLNLTVTGTGTQTFSLLTVNPGLSSINNTVSTDTLTLGNITRPTAGGLVNFTTTGVIQTTKVNGNGILGTWATTGTGVAATPGTGLSYATNSAGNVAAYAAATAGTAATLGNMSSAATNYYYDNAGGNITLGGAATGYTLEITDSAGSTTLAMGANNLTLNGLMNSSGNSLAITSTGGLVTIGTGTLTALHELVIWGDGQNTTISANIVNGTAASALTYADLGTGTLTLGGTDTYTGATTIDAGTLSLTGSLSGTSGVTINGNASFVETGGAITTGSFTQASSGISTLGAGNTYTGATLVSNGTLSLTGSLASSVTTSNLIAGGVSGNQGGIFSESSTGALTGGASFTQGSFGTSTLAGTNTYSGATTVNNGTLSLTGSLGGTGVTVNGTSVFSEASGGAITTGSFNQASSGTSTLGGTNTYTGPTTVNEGTLSLTGTLNGSSVSTLAGIFNESSTGTITGIGASFTQNSGGTSTLAGTNTYGGGTTISAGTLQFPQTTNMPASGTVSVGNVGTLAVDVTNLNSGTSYFTDGSPTTAGTVEALFAGIGGQGAPVTYTQGASIGLDTTNANTGTFTVAGNLATANAGVGLTKLGTGVLLLTGANTYTGPTTVNVGTLSLTGSMTSAVMLNGPAVFTESSTGSISGSGGGGVGFEQVSTGTLVAQQPASTLAGVNTYTGETIVAAGTLSLTGSVADRVVATSTGLIQESSTGVIGGGSNGSLDFSTSNANGTGTSTLSGTNTYTGGTTLTSGNILLGSSTALGGGTINLNSNGGINLQASTPIVLMNPVIDTSFSTVQGMNSITFGGSFTPQGGSGSNGIHNNIATNSGSLTLAGPLILNTTANGTGGIGTFGNGNTFTGSGNTTISGVIEDWTGGVASTGTNGGALTYAGTGTVTLSSANLISGTTTITTGNILLSNALALQNSIVDINAGSAGNTTNGLQFNAGLGDVFTIGALGTSSANEALVDVGGSAVQLIVGNNNQSGTYQESLSDGGVGGSLTKIGTGTETLTGANTYAGTTTVNGGVLNIGGGNSNGSIIAVTSLPTPLALGGGTLAYTRTGTVTQNFTSTAINSGFSGISTTTGSQTLGTGTITQHVGGQVNFNTLGTGTVTTANSNVSGILGTWASAGAGASTGIGTGLNYVTVNGSSQIVDLLATSQTALTSAGAIGATTNYNLSANGTTTLGASSPFTGNTLQFIGTAAQTLDNGSNNIALSGLMNSGVGGVTVSDSGSLLIGTSSVVGNNELSIFADTQNTTISSVIANNGSSTGALTYGGPSAGTLTLGGTDTYTGATTVNSGSLSLASTGSLTATSGVTINGVSVLSEAVGGAIGGGATLTQNSTGTSTLAGANTYTGATTVNAGTVSLTGSLSGSNVVTSGLSELTGNVSGGGVFTETSTGTIAGPSATFTQGSTGISLLGNANTYGGGTSITAGTLVAANSTALGSGLVTLNAAAPTAYAQPSLLVSTAGITVANAITVGSNPTVGAYTIGGLNASGTANYTGNIILNQAVTLQAATNGAVDFNTGTWNTNNNAIAVGSVSNLGTGFSTNTLYSQPPSAYVSGTTTITVPNTTGLLIGQGITGNGIPAGDTIVGLTPTTITLSAPTTGVNNGNVANTVTTTYAGTVEFDNTVTTTGGVTVNFGTLAIGTTLGVNTNVTVNSGATLAGGSVSGNAGIITGTVTVNPGGTINGTGGGLTLNQGSALTLAGPSSILVSPTVTDTLAGNITDTFGVVAVGSGSSTTQSYGSVLNLTSGGTVTVADFGIFTVNGTVNGNTSVALGGFLGGSGTITGGTSVTGGTYNGSNLIQTGTLTFKGTGNILEGLDTVSGGVVIDGLSNGAVTQTAGFLTGSVTDNSSGSSAFNGVIQDPSPLTGPGNTVTMNGNGVGTGTLALNGANNTFTGLVAVNNGLVSFTTGNTSSTGVQSLGENSGLTLGSTGNLGILQYNGTGTATMAKNVAVTGNGEIQNSGTGLLTLSGNLNKPGANLDFAGGANGILVTGMITGGVANSDLYVTSGTTTIDNSNNSYVGATHVGVNGTMINGLSGALPSSTVVELGNTGGLAAESGAAFTNTYELNGFTQTVAGLTSTNPAGFTDVNSVVGGSATTSILTVSPSGTDTYAGVIGGGGTNYNNINVIMGGAGTLTLSGVNSYTGTTQVNSGVLAITGSLANGSAVTVGGSSASGTPTLTGTGAIGGAVTVASAGTGVAGTITAGSVGGTTGTLTVGSIEFQSGSDFAVNINGSSNALLAISGSALIDSGADITINATGLTAGNYVLATAASGLNSGVFTVIGSLPAGYTLAYSGTELQLTQGAVIGTPASALSVVTTPPGSIITGGSIAFTFTVSNTASAGGTTLTATATPVAPNVTGVATPTPIVVPAGTTSGTESGFTFNGTTVGAAQTGTFTVSGNAANSPVNGTVSVNVYGHASTTLTAGTLTLGPVHAGYASPVTSTNSLSAPNAAGFDVDLAGSAPAAGNVSVNSIGGVIAGGSGTITATLATGQAPGAISTPLTYTFADDSSLNGASSNVGTASITVTGQVYSGQSIWNDNTASASWGTLTGAGSEAFGINWQTNDGSPGLDPAFTGVDTATFGDVAGGQTVETVNLNAAAPNLNSISFSSTTTNYTVGQGSGSSSITLSGTTPSINVTGSAPAALTAPIVLGSPTTTVNVGSGDNLSLSGGVSESSAGNGVTFTGPGTTTLGNTNSYTGATTVSGGNLVLTGTTAAGSAVTVGNNTSISAVLSGTGTVNGSVTTLTNGGNIAYIAPGVNTPGSNFGNAGTLSIGGNLNIGEGSTLDIDLSTTTASGNDLIQLTGGGTLTLGTDGTLTVDYNLLGATLATGTPYTLINGASSVANFDGTNITTLGATNYTASYSIVSNALDVTFTVIPVPAAYFNGLGTDMNTAGNYDMDVSSGSPNVAAAPSGGTNVFFSADRNNGAFAHTPNVSAPLSVNSINFGVGTGVDGGITISSSSPSDTLTIMGTNANGNTAGNGIDIASGGGSDTISAPVVLGGNQTWTPTDAISTLTVSGQVSGAAELTTAGEGAVILSNPTGNTYNGGTVVSSGTLYANGGVAGSSSATGSGAISVSGGASLGGSGVIRPGFGNGITLAAGGTLISGGVQAAVSPTTTAGPGLVLDNMVAQTTILNASVGTANLTFYLGAGNIIAPANDFANPNTNSSYMTVLGNTTGELAFGTGDTITLNDLTGINNLQLKIGTAYLLIQAGTTPGLLTNNDLYSGLTTSGGVEGGVLQNGWVTNLTLAGTAAGENDGVRLFLYDGDLEVAPEPGTWALMLGGLALLLVIQRMRRRSRE